MNYNTRQDITVVVGIILFIVCALLNLISIDWIAGCIYTVIIMNGWIQSDDKESV